MPYPRTARTEYCKTCKYMRAHPKCGLHTMILEGHPYSEVAKRFKGKGKGWEAGNYYTIQKHWEAQHMVSRQLLAAKDIKDRKKALDLMECAREIYNDCKDNATKSKEKAESSRDFRDASGCWDPATRALSILKPPEMTQTTNINMASDDVDARIAELIERGKGRTEEST